MPLSVLGSTLVIPLTLAFPLLLCWGFSISLMPPPVFQVASRCLFIYPLSFGTLFTASCFPVHQHIQFKIHTFMRHVYSTLSDDLFNLDLLSARPGFLLVGCLCPLSGSPYVKPLCPIQELCPFCWPILLEPSSSGPADRIPLTSLRGALSIFHYNYK